MKEKEKKKEKKKKPGNQMVEVIMCKYPSPT